MKDGTAGGMREAIATALISMLDEVSYTSISVRELARRAHVSRSSFYRCFGSKDDALLYYAQLAYARRFADDSWARADAGRGSSAAFMRKRFDFVREHARYFRTLLQNGLLDQAFECLDLSMADILSEGAASSSPYARALFAGGSASVIKCWIQRDFRESEDELVELFLSVAACADAPGAA